MVADAVGQVDKKVFTQRRKDRKDAKARSKYLTRLCVFAIFASLREKPNRQPLYSRSPRRV